MTVGPSVYWYMTRSSGAVSLILLTASVVVGVAVSGRFQARGTPRFVIDGIHRTTSLLAMVFLVIHIVTAVLDSFASISLVDAVIPFAGTYRPLWLGLGAVAFDLLLAVAITSWLRGRIGHGTWRSVHWLAYASWPVAVLHGFGTGSDVHQTWLLAINAACILAVVIAVVARVMVGWPANVKLRIGAVGLAAAFVVGLLAWLPSGPLGKGWARRSGTPSSLLRPTGSRGGHA
jgi:methionine sulfoxide reductase heme-binding subunit